MAVKKFMPQNAVGIIAGSAVGLAVVILLFIWCFCRIEPGNGEIAVLIKKTGKTLPENQIVATSPEYKGIQLDVLGEGRYFRNPYVWEWQIKKVTDIPAGKFGVLVRKFGKNLPEGEILAVDENSKGIVREVLGTGRHRINPYAYEVKLCDDIVIMPGNVGVVANLCGKDIFSGTPNDLKNHQGFIVSADRKGVQQKVLKEGTHRINPYIQSVAIVNIQSQRYEFSGKDAIGFITLDGFHITLEGTVEFNISAESAPLLTQEVGNMEDIMKKLILPSVSGFARIEGSKKSATEFIVGESRQLFQNQLEEFLRRNCLNWGVSINSVLIRDINPPQEIAEIIRNREIAAQEAKKFSQQIQQAKSATELERQKMLALQSRSKVEATTRKITSEIAAKQSQLEKVIAAKTELAAANLQFKTAQAEAQADLAMAEAERAVIAAGNKSEVEILKRNIAAYGGGEAYLRSKLYEKIAPNIESIMTNAVGGNAFGLPLLKNHSVNNNVKTTPAAAVQK
ncbi:MAG: hypothetical protein E7056_04190 [Lentisphaerae bacterium]|nr:hypothetical protein [Lentisphaerota bacterium]